MTASYFSCNSEEMADSVANLVMTMKNYSRGYCQNRLRQLALNKPKCWKIMSPAAVRTRSFRRSKALERLVPAVPFDTRWPAYLRADIFPCAAAPPDPNTPQPDAPRA